MSTAGNIRHATGFETLWWK